MAPLTPVAVSRNFSGAATAVYVAFGPGAAGRAIVGNRKVGFAVVAPLSDTMWSAGIASPSTFGTCSHR